ncbi:MAG: Hsp20/alpha crystallin family protein [Minisyncoccales bacterium]
MLVPFDPFKNLDSFFEEDDFSSLLSSPKVHKVARMNIEETDEDVIVEAEVPGVDADDIDISIEGDILKMKAGKEERTEDEGKNYHRREFRRHYFERAARLPSKVKADEAEANYKNGVLKLKIPKREEEKSKKVKVEVEE